MVEYDDGNRNQAKAEWFREHGRPDLAEVFEKADAIEAGTMTCTYCGSDRDVSAETGLCRTCGREDA